MTWLDSSHLWNDSDSTACWLESWQMTRVMTHTHTRFSTWIMWSCEPWFLSVYKRGIHYTIVTWLDLKENSNDLTWLATQVLLTWLDLWLEQGWLVTTLSEAAKCLNPLPTWAAPVIMFGMKSLWPGASSRVTSLWLVSNLVSPTSIVMPLKIQSLEPFFIRFLFVNSYTHRLVVNQLKTIWIAGTHISHWSQPEYTCDQCCNKSSHRLGLELTRVAIFDLTWLDSIFHLNDLTRVTCEMTLTWLWLDRMLTRVNEWLESW